MPQCSQLPTLAITPYKIISPAKANPIQFQSLYLKLGREYLASITGPHIGLRCEIPVLPWIFRMERRAWLKPFRS